MRGVIAVAADFLKGDYCRFGRILDRLEQLQESPFLRRVQLRDALDLGGDRVAAKPAQLGEQTADLKRGEAGVARLDLQHLDRIGEGRTGDRCQVIDQWG